MVMEDWDVLHDLNRIIREKIQNMVDDVAREVTDAMLSETRERILTAMDDRLRNLWYEVDGRV